MVTQERLRSVRDYDRFTARSENRDRLFELVHGEIVEKVVTQEHAIIAGNIITEINLYLREHEIGRAGVETRHESPGDEHNARLADVSYVAGANRPVVRMGAAPMPDLAVEIQSPDDSYKRMVEKAEYYLAHGVKMVWLVYPRKRLIEVLTRDERLLLSEDEALTGGDLLPGFAMPVSAVFRSI